MRIKGKKLYKLAGLATMRVPSQKLSQVKQANDIIAREAELVICFSYNSLPYGLSC